MSRATILESLLRRMTDAASGMLDPEEREAACGDLAESGEPAGRALREMLSLVIRRRAACLGDWYQWLNLVFLTIPLAALVSLAARRTADGSAIYLWLYLNNWDLNSIQTPGFWQELLQCAQGVLLSYVALACWSWTTGLLVGWSVGRTLWLRTAVFVAVVVTVGVCGVPQHFGHILVLQRARNFRNNAAVFVLAFYRQVLPKILEIFFVVLPAWRGMRQGFRIIQLPRTARVIMLILSAAVVGSLVSENLIWWQMHVWDIWPLRLPRLPSIMPLAIAAPAAYMLLVFLFRRTSQSQDRPEFKDRSQLGPRTNSRTPLL
jgi:hypothetical protein